MNVRIQSVGPAVAALLLSFGAAAQSSVDQKIDALQREIDRLKEETKRLKDAQSAPASAPAAVEKSADADAGAQPATTIFGYGEFNYNHYRDADRGSKA